MDVCVCVCVCDVSSDGRVLFELIVSWLTKCRCRRSFSSFHVSRHHLMRAACSRRLRTSSLPIYTGCCCCCQLEFDISIETWDSLMSTRDNEMECGGRLLCLQRLCLVAYEDYERLYACDALEFCRSSSLMSLMRWRAHRQANSNVRSTSQPSFNSNFNLNDDVESDSDARTQFLSPLIADS